MFLKRKCIFIYFLPIVIVVTDSKSYNFLKRLVFGKKYNLQTRQIVISTTIFNERLMHNIQRIAAGCEGGR